MPIAIDTRILQDSPMLALAIAAEHLIAVFHTHGASMENSEAAKVDFFFQYTRQINALTFFAILISLIFLSKYITSDAIKIEPNSLVFYYCGWFDF